MVRDRQQTNLGATKAQVTRPIETLKWVSNFTK